MSEQCGKLLMCDRCGESIFLKELEFKVEDKETDGGYTRWKEYNRKFEDIPGAWKRVQFSELYLTSPAFYTLCPRCSELFEKYRDMFFEIEETECQ